MSATHCTRCGRTLPPDVVRELGRGTRCPFCAALLERPRADARPRVKTPTGRASVLASTIVSHTTGHQASPAPPDAALWLSSLLHAKAWETAPAMPAVDGPSPAPIVASATQPAPLAAAAPIETVAPPAPVDTALAPAPVETALAPAPVETASSPAPLESPLPTPPVASSAPPPPPLEALPELPQTAFETSGPVQAAPPPPPVAALIDEPPPIRRSASAPVAPASDLETDAVPLPTVATPRRVLIAVGAVALGGVLALFLRGSTGEAPAAEQAPAVAAQFPATEVPPPEAPAAPVATTPVVAAAPPAPAAAKEAPHAEAVEIGLDPAGAAEHAPAAEKAAEPRPHHHAREQAADDAGETAPNDFAKYRGLAQSLEKEGKTAEALAAYQQALMAAKRTSERHRIARRMYELTHPGE